jgi:hypothetical protein
MSKRIQGGRLRGFERRVLSAMLGLLLVFSLEACDSLLDVSNPGSVEAADLNNPALAQTLVNSALGRFECAYTNYVAAVSLLSHELINISNLAGLGPFGQRSEATRNNLGSCPSDRDAFSMGAYSPLQQARFLAEESARLIEGFPESQITGNKRTMLGLLEAYAGYSTLMLGEGFCEMAFDQGPVMTRQQVFQRAEQRFAAAIGHADAAGNVDLRRMASLGRARTRLNLGNLSGAASDAEEIPIRFVWNAEYSTVDGMRENRIYNLNRRNNFVGVEPVMYGNVTLAGAPDPRVPVTNTGRSGQFGPAAGLWWTQEKYNAPSSSIPMASWEEAQLIIAEARPAEAATAINRLRASEGLAPYSPSGGGVLADVLEERRRQLFIEGHRLNDMIRHDLPFPTGINHRNQLWGPVTCIPLPDQERFNNPNIAPM